MVKIIWTLGGQHRNMVEYSNLCLTSSILHVSSQLFYQNLDGQMDAACMHVLLYNLHMHAILSRVLHHYPRSNFRWNRRCSDVECQMYLFDTGEKIWKNTIKLSLIIFQWKMYICILYILVIIQIGERYAKLTSVDVEAIIVRFFGIFFLFFQSSSVWGNLISSLGMYNLKLLNESIEIFTIISLPKYNSLFI